jgi:hypothetical protein
MTTLTITLSDQSLNRLKELAGAANLTPEELVQARVEEWLGRPEDEFARAAAYVLRKNAELYRRLA